MTIYKFSAERQENTFSSLLDIPWQWRYYDHFGLQISTIYVQVWMLSKRKMPCSGDRLFCGGATRRPELTTWWRRRRRICL